MAGSAILKKAFQGKWALVTGASAGIGEALAVELAASGANLVLTARRADRLETLAQRLRSEHKIETQVVAADLGDRASPQQLFEATEGHGTAVDVLINNAGFGYYGEFVAGDPNWQRTMVEVNCTAVVDLTRLFLPKMVERRLGWVMIVASTAAYQPVAYMATYAATKAFDRMLAEALAEETKRFGIKVSALCPGPTESEFGQVAGSPASPGGRAVQAAEVVARRGLEGLVQGKHWVIPSVTNGATVFVQRILPRGFITGAVERAFRPESVKAALRK